MAIYAICDKNRRKKMSRLLENRKSILVEIDMEWGQCKFPSSISAALLDADLKMKGIENRFSETQKTICALTPDCDKMDYILAASSGALCGLIDIFLVGKPEKSPLGEITDQWFADRTIDFARLCGYNGANATLPSAIRFLEKKFKIPYDQSVGGDTFKELLGLTPANHHCKSLGHNPTLLGLFFSILNQYNNTSTFVADGELITLKNAEEKFELQGHNVPSKLFCGFVNWIGHLISDVSGSSSSKGRGLGIPSPIWMWANDVIAIKRKLNITASDYDRVVNELALEIFKKGYDARFQTTQTIPVLLNELIVRLFYSIRRMLRYFSNPSGDDRCLRQLWKMCEPFSNATVKRMLMIAHGSFCVIDLSDVMVRGVVSGGKKFGIAEFFMRLNIMGVGCFTMSLYGEAECGKQRAQAKKEIVILMREKSITEYYLAGLQNLAAAYNDEMLMTFVEDLQSSDLYKSAFQKTVALAEMRNVPEDKILRSKTDIDNYFQGAVRHA